MVTARLTSTVIKFEAGGQDTRPSFYLYVSYKHVFLIKTANALCRLRIRKRGAKVACRVPTRLEGFALFGFPFCPFSMYVILLAYKLLTRRAQLRNTTKFPKT